MTATPLTAVVTGASRGIGAAIARALATGGYRVALVARGVPALQQVANEIGESAIIAPCDITDPTAVQTMADQVTQTFGKTPDVVVNNAGVFQLAPLDAMTVDTFTSTVQTNVIAPFLLVRAFLPAMRTRGSGHIVTIGSIADRVVLPHNGAYAPAKFAARAMHEVLRAEVHGSGVRATLISPSATDTPLWNEILATTTAANIPSRDDMLPADAVADAVLFAIRRPPNVNIDELRLSHA